MSLCNQMVNFWTDFISTPLLLWSTLVMLILFHYLTRRPKDVPPGPLGLPLVGYVQFLSKKPHILLKTLAEKYGEIVSFQLAGTTYVILNSYQAVRKAFVEKGNEFAGRPQNKAPLQWVVDGQGILQSEGPAWKEHRRFALHTLRDFGFGKQSLEQRVYQMADDLIKVLDETKGRPYNLDNDLSNAAFNVICSLMFDKHYPVDDQEFLTLRRLVGVFMSHSQGAGAFVEGPLVKVLPLRYVPGFQELFDIKERLQKIANGLIKEHEDSFDAQNLRDYVDVYLNEKRTAEIEGRLGESTFTHERLANIAINVMIAGSETTATTLNWTLKLLSIHEDVQKRIHSELDNVVGPERQPSILDRPNMPYTEATIMEVHRFANMLILLPPHSNPEESELLGYRIPKRSVVMVNHFGINHDPTNYHKPEEFNPSRFIDPKGNLIKCETIIPFSIGHRSCMGESLARMELFVFLTRLLQRYHFELPFGVEPQGIMNTAVTFISRPPPYQLCAKFRQ